MAAAGGHGGLGGDVGGECGHGEGGGGELGRWAAIPTHRCPLLTLLQDETQRRLHQQHTAQQKKTKYALELSERSKHLEELQAVGQQLDATGHELLEETKRLRKKLKAEASAIFESEVQHNDQTHKIGFSNTIAPVRVYVKTLLADKVRARARHTPTQ